jgi:hypothetical protein
LSRDPVLLQLAVRGETVSDVLQKKTLDFTFYVEDKFLNYLGSNTCWGSRPMLGWIRICLVRSGPLKELWYFAERSLILAFHWNPSSSKSAGSENLDLRSMERYSLGRSFETYRFLNRKKCLQT